ncbi:MAG: 2-succinyl-5-enolpyruvyl-6-hydroxy-3-cyclohexene-1-carboxylic-acid synthase [Magnetospirillum sp. WYHS-4]
MAADLNFRWAATLTAALADLGVRHAVISPGSRSTPLVLASRATEGLKTWVQVDERCAAFFALGLAKGTGAPVALVATSGSAPAHWYPAVIEASQAGVPLLLLSADRPPEMQDCGANQTLDQTRLFGAHVRAFLGLPVPDGEALAALPNLAARAVDRALWPLPGPVHINLPFREPLVPDGMPALASVAVPRLSLPPAMPAEVPELRGRGVIVCAGNPAPPAADVAELARTLRVPVLADPLSGLRFGSHDLEPVMVRYDAWARGERFVAGSRPDWVLSFGGAPVSKPLLRFLAGCGAAEFIVVDDRGSWSDPVRRATHMLRAGAGAVCRALADTPPAPSGWLERFQEADAVATRLADAFPIAERDMVQAATSTAGLLFCGNSLPVREVDAFSGKGPAGPVLTANRGASGIDGSVSTLLGLAAAHGPAVGLIGDLALYHDMNGLLMARDGGLDAVVAVPNNGGGAIFEYLPQARLPGFADHWLTPTGIDLGKVAGLYGLPYRSAATGAEFATALDEAIDRGGVHLLEVAIDRERSVASHKAYWAAVAAAVDAL